MRTVLYIILISLAVACSSTTSREVSYNIAPTETDSDSKLKIGLKCLAEPEGRTTFLFPDNAWGQDGLYRALDSLIFPSEAYTYELNADSGWITVQHPKGLETMEFEYHLKQDRDSITTRNIYRPIVQEEYFHVYGHNLLMIPRAYASSSDTEFDVKIVWEGFPQDYTIHNSFDSNKREQVLKGISERELSSSVFLGGDFRIYELNVKGNTVYFALRGDWLAFEDEQFVELLKTTISSQRDFMQDHSQKYYSVSIIPLERDRGSSFQGTGLTNSFAMSATNNQYLEFDGLVYLLNHEHQHNWIGNLIKNENEEEQYWFSEGFTDYYTLKNIARNKINGEDEGYMISKINEVIKEHYSSPVKDAPNSEINYANFWSDYNYGVLPYKRGALFAFILDQKIYNESNGEFSLDDVILSVKEAAMENGQRLSHEYFINTVDPYLPHFEAYFNTYIVDGVLLDLDREFEALGLDYDRHAEVFDLGFELEENHIINIQESSNAYKAGLRNGDRVVDRSYYLGDPKYEATIGIHKDGIDQIFKFFPAKTVAMIQLAPTARNKEILSL